MIVSSLKQVDLLYALFLGRFPENNFVRQENIGRPALKIAEVMMGSDEFRASVLERFLLYQQLPHRGLPLQLLPTVLEFISEAGLAPPFTGVAITDWAGVLANVLCSAPCRKFLEVHGEVGERMRQQLLGISSPREMSEEHEAKRGATTETDIASGIEIIGNTICRGWIIDRNDPNALLHVRLRLNGRTVKITAADEFRRDVQALHGGAGRAGFTIRLDRLEDAPYLDRGSIEITELSCGAVVLPEQEVEFSPFPGTRVEAEVRETLIQLRAYLAKPEVVSDRQNATIPSRLWPAPVRSRRQHAEPESVNRDALLELLAQLEQQLRRLEYEQSWALPLYGAVRPLVGMVVSPPPIPELVTFPIIILDHEGTRRHFGDAGFDPCPKSEAS